MYSPLRGSTPHTTDPFAGACGAATMSEGSHGGGEKPLVHVNRRASGVPPKSPGVAAAGADEPPGEGVGVGAWLAGSGVDELGGRGA